ncbi:MAG: hypothetical protein J6Z79_00570 [Clostridia bacterium]|nr:hypothetical protein [Clostridia bacterium]
MTTANDIFSAALSLMGADGERARYESRALAGINLLAADLVCLDRALKGEVAAAAAAVPSLGSLQDVTDLADILTRSLIPVGLAAFLLNEEEESRAAFFQRIYRSEKEILLRQFSTGRRHSVRNVYGGCHGAGV